MTKPRVVFLSQSYSKKDKRINDLIHAILKAMGFYFVNVRYGSSQLPPDKALQLISESEGLIAICTKRSKKANGKYEMPPAVFQEITMAFSSGKPRLIFRENGVVSGGFTSNYATWQDFKRDQLYNPETIQNIIKSIYDFKDEINTDLSASVELNKYFIEVCICEISLSKYPDGLKWSHTLTKKLRFETQFNREIITRVWPNIPSKFPNTAKPGAFKVSLSNPSRDFRIHKRIITHNPSELELALKFIPNPKQGDFFDLTRNFTSKYINPIYLTKTELRKKPLEVSGEMYYCHDGIQVVEEIKKLIIQFKFPLSFGQNSNEIVPLIAHYGKGLNFQADWLLKRIKFGKYESGNSLIIELETLNPLQGYFYGIAWNPPIQNK